MMFKEFRGGSKTTTVDVIIILAVVFIILSVAYTMYNNICIWNDGKCECGGEWEYVEMVSRFHGSKNHVTTTTTYIYKCNQCGRLHEFEILR